MSDSLGFGVFAGFMLGIVFCIGLSSLPDSGIEKYKKAIEECEKSLPRDKHCKVIGVVDDGQR